MRKTPMCEDRRLRSRRAALLWPAPVVVCVFVGPVLPLSIPGFPPLVAAPGTPSGLGFCLLLHDAGPSSAFLQAPSGRAGILAEAGIVGKPPQLHRYAVRIDPRPPPWVSASGGSRRLVVATMDLLRIPVTNHRQRGCKTLCRAFLRRTARNLYRQSSLYPVTHRTSFQGFSFRA